MNYIVGDKPSMPVWASLSHHAVQDNKGSPPKSPWRSYQVPLLLCISLGEPLWRITRSMNPSRSTPSESITSASFLFISRQSSRAYVLYINLIPSHLRVMVQEGDSARLHCIPYQRPPQNNDLSIVTFQKKPRLPNKRQHPSSIRLKVTNNELRSPRWRTRDWEKLLMRILKVGIVIGLSNPIGGL